VITVIRALAESPFVWFIAAVIAAACIAIAVEDRR